MEQEIESSKAKDAPENVAEWGNLIEGGRAAVSELNARLEERAQDYIKASARDVAEIQRLRVELDAIKRRIVKPLRWFHNADDVADANISRADGINCEYVVVHRIAGGYDVAVWINSRIAKKVDGASMQACRDIAEDLHCEAVLARLETEV